MQMRDSCILLKKKQQRQKKDEQLKLEKNVLHQDKCAAHMFKKSSLCRIQYATAVVIAVE